jgi:hypothetical protein
MKMSLVINAVDEQMSEGLHSVTITRVEDLGLQETRFGPKECAAIYFTPDYQNDAKGKPVDACLKVIQTLHPNFNVAKLLTQLSVPFGDVFDLNELIGISCEVVVQHREGDGKIKAYVVAVLELRKPAGTRSLALVR